MWSQMNLKMETAYCIIIEFGHTGEKRIKGGEKKIGGGKSMR